MRKFASILLLAFAFVIFAGCASEQSDSDTDDQVDEKEFAVYNNTFEVENSKQSLNDAAVTLEENDFQCGQFDGLNPELFQRCTREVQTDSLNYIDRVDMANLNVDVPIDQIETENGGESEADMNELNVVIKRFEADTGDQVDLPQSVQDELRSLIESNL